MISGRYRLEREIGRGGSGTVHLATDEVLGRRVAIKRVGMLPGADDVERERAEREARLAAALNHPHVVSVFDLVVDGDVRWLVMEYVDGDTLAARVRDSGPLGATEAAGLLAQAADALVEAHARGIVHRDVKPSNIMIAAGEAKLTDFGIARSAEDASLTQTGLVTGSPAYLAPEVASGASATPASDVWSLGATLFHAVSGRPPYDVGDNLIGALYQIVHEDPPQLAPDHPLAGLVAVTMHRDPAARWPMARVRDELSRVARGQRSTAPAVSHSPAPLPPATAVPVSPRERTGVLSATVPAPATGRGGRGRTRRWALVAAGAVLAAGAVGGAYVVAGRDTPQASAEDTGGSQATTSPSPSEETTPPLTAEDTKAQMDAFVASYLGTVTTQPRAAFAQLTPAFQEQSGGYEGYMSWWGKVRSASLVDVQSDPSDLTVGYTVSYVMKSGARSTQQVRLQLERLDDQLLIAGEG